MDKTIKKLIRINLVVFFVWLPSILAIIINYNKNSNNLFSNKLAKIQPSPTPSPTPTPTPTPTPIPKPIKISIPKLNIESDIIELSFVEETNQIEVPKDANKIGWYKYSFPPGASGSAVLTGHYDTPTGAPAVFYNLGNLEAGDQFTITNLAGQNLVYEVKEVLNLPLENYPKDKIYGERKTSETVLITCSGYFNQVTQLYSHRLTIISQLEKTESADVSTIAQTNQEQYLMEPYQLTANLRNSELSGPYLRLNQENDNKISIYLASYNQELIATDIILKYSPSLIKIDPKNIVFTPEFESFYIKKLSQGLLQLSLFSDPSRNLFKTINSKNNEIKIAEIKYEKTYEGAYPKIEILKQDFDPTSKILIQTGESIHQNSDILESVNSLTIKP